MLIFQLAALTFTAAVLCLTLKKDQPAFAFLVSVCAAAGVLAAVLHQAQPVLDWLDTWGRLFPGAGLGCLVRVLASRWRRSLPPIPAARPAWPPRPPLPNWEGASWHFCRPCRFCKNCWIALRATCNSRRAAPACRGGKLTAKCCPAFGRRAHPTAGRRLGLCRIVADGERLPCRQHRRATGLWLAGGRVLAGGGRAGPAGRGQQLEALH